MICEPGITQMQIEFNELKATPLIRHGLSLVELMIAMVVTLIVLGAMMALFQYGSIEMKRGRAAVDLTMRLRAVEETLRRDLSQITVDVKPHHHLPAIPKGYFEIVEGPGRDYVPSSFTVNPNHRGDSAHEGDFDDFLAFTIRSPGKPYVDGSSSSQFAEVAWFVNGRRIIRKFRLVSDANNDELVELGQRGKRFGHEQGNYPHTSDLNFGKLKPKQSEVMLTNVIGFDVQVFDPDASQYLVREDDSRDIIGVADLTDIGAVLGVPGGSMDPVSRGAFVDLGTNRRGQRGERPVFINPPHPRYGKEAVYETGTSIYDRNEVDDSGSNGVDDLPLIGEEEKNGIVDDIEERESVAPYNERLRGIRIRVRVMDPDTKLIQQVTIMKSFID